MAYLRLRRLLELAVLDRPALASLIGSRAGADRGAAAVEILGEAVVPAHWGGAWRVWTCRPAEAADG